MFFFGVYKILPRIKIVYIKHPHKRIHRIWKSMLVYFKNFPHKILKLLYIKLITYSGVDIKKTHIHTNIHSQEIFIKIHVYCIYIICIHLNTIAITYYNTFIHINKSLRVGLLSHRSFIRILRIGAWLRQAPCFLVAIFILFEYSYMLDIYIDWLNLYIQCWA